MNFVEANGVGDKRRLAIAEIKKKHIYLSMAVGKKEAAF